MMNLIGAIFLEQTITLTKFYNTARVWSGQRILTPSVEQSPEDLNVPFSRQPDQPIS